MRGGLVWIMVRREREREREKANLLFVFPGDAQSTLTVSKKC